LPPLRGKTQESAKGILLKCEPVSLLTKKMTQQKSLRVVEDDLTAGDKPEFERAFHVVRAANILNRAYFADATLMQMLNKLKNRLKPGGILIVCRTNDEGINNGTIFRLAESVKFQILNRIGSGSEIEGLLSGV
jgi:chemotaxis methyl-accepting protein methylase